MTKLVIILVTLVALSMTAAGKPKTSGKSFLNLPKVNPISVLFGQRPQTTPVLKKHDNTIPSSVVEDYLETRLDNFNPQNSATFNQRYLMNGEYFTEDGPLFIFIGGEWRIEPQYIEAGLMFDLAHDLEGHMFYLEHRFYGESIPTEDFSLENLRYLNVDQALADIAHFITYIIDLYGAQNSKVFLVGLHYSATLAIWARQKYPHLIDGVWANGAPVESRVNFHEFKEVAGGVYLSVGGAECFSQIDQGFDELDDLAETNMDELVEMFNLCDPLETQNDKWIFFQIVAEFYSLLAIVATNEEIIDICEEIQDGDSAAEGLSTIVELLLERFGGDCLPINYEYLMDMDRDESINSTVGQAGVRQSSFQVCSQIGWYHSPDAEYQPFGSNFPIDLFYNICEDVFGFNSETLNENSDRINTAFGGTNLDHLTRVIYTYGMHDAWRILGVQERLNDFSDALVIYGASQWELMLPFNRDNEYLVEAESRVHEVFHIWNYYDGNYNLFYEDSSEETSEETSEEDESLGTSEDTSEGTSEEITEEEVYEEDEARKFND